MDGQPGGESSEVRFSGEQKIGVGMLLVFAVICISLGMLQIRNRLYAPFALNNSVPGTLKNEINSPEALRYRDTDNDGLNDFDELYQHQTSPYLADSDSDGLSDKQEIQEGSNPLCAKGKNCSGPIESGDDIALEQSVTATLGAAPALDLAEETALKEDVLSDPVQLRKLMIGAGMKADLANKMTDQQIMALVAQTLASTTPAKSASKTQ